MTQAAFNDGKGAIVSASRSILYAHRDAHLRDEGLEGRGRSAVLEMRRDVNSISRVGTGSACANR